MTTQYEESAAVRAVMERYADAVYRADAPALRGLFHPGASMNGYLGDEFLVGTPEPFFADIESHPPMADSDAPFKAEISDIQVAGRAASAALEETGFFGSARFINYFHLLKIEGEWKLIGKTFASL
jgi:Putative lumazine-binding